jgi:hypothetical protein
MAVGRSRARSRTAARDLIAISVRSLDYWWLVCRSVPWPGQRRGVWMAVLIRTSDVPPAYRYDAWRSIVCDTLGPLDFRSDPDVPLSGEIEAGHLGPVNVGRVQTSTPHSVHRTPGLIRRGSAELYRVVLAMSGNPRLR